jgi:hypothetical protein
MIQNVAKINVKKVTLAQRPPDEELRECCGEPWLVLANRADLDNQEQNDVTLVFERCDTLNVSIRYNGGAEQAAAGIPITFPNDSEIKGFLIDWKQYANIGGQLIQGSYDVYVETIYFGFTQKFFYNSYRLLEFNRMNTEGTIRIASRFNDYSDLYDVDFSGSGAMDMVRLRGFFGFRQPNYETKNNTEISKKRKKVFNKSNNTYSLIIEPTLECKTQRVEQLHLLHASELFISDYNKYNHYKEIIEIPVILSDEDSPEFDYFEGIGTKYAKVLATFKDRISKRKSKNIGTGENVPIPDISLNTGLVCPTPTPCAPVTYNVEYADGTPIESGSEPSGGNIEVIVPNPTCAPATIQLTSPSGVLQTVTGASGSTTSQTLRTIGRMPYKTGSSGASTPPVAGVDGLTQRGRNFLTLDYNNAWGNTNRFTWKDGTQVYPNGVTAEGNGYAVDNSTWDRNGKVLLIAYVTTTRTFANQATTALTTTIDGLTGWEMINAEELSEITTGNSVVNKQANYAPFNIPEGTIIITSTETVNNNTQCLTLTSSGVEGSISKAGLRHTFFVRLATLTIDSLGNVTIS